MPVQVRKLQIMKSAHALKFAIRGIAAFFANEKNGQIQLAMAAAAVILGRTLRISSMEWLVVTFFIIMVLTLEMINTAIEKLCDVIHPDYHPEIKIIKDIAAGSVLLGAIGSVIAGAVIFIPKLLNG